MRRDPEVLMSLRQSAVTRSAPSTPRDCGAGPTTRTVLQIAFVASLAAGVVSCKSAEEAPPKPEPPQIGARLQPTGGSVVTGFVSFKPFDGGLTAAVTLYATRAGRWRVVIHATGICTSPNGFSAGPPWIMPGTSEPPSISMTTGEEGTSSATVRLQGLVLDGPNGITGKSVVVHMGLTGSLDAEPGVANDRAACGVIEAVKPLF
jgi:Cu/Zn superoxide dismutase